MTHCKWRFPNIHSYMIKLHLQRAWIAHITHLLSLNLNNIYGLFVYLHYTWKCVCVCQGQKVLYSIHPYHLLQYTFCAWIQTTQAGPDSHHHDNRAAEQPIKALLSPFLHADWCLGLQPVVECPSLTSLLPCTHPTTSYIFSMQITATVVTLHCDVVTFDLTWSVIVINCTLHTGFSFWFAHSW